MAGSINKVMLIGNLGRDPEIRRTEDGRPIANLRLATSESWRDKQTGERREKVEWHNVVIFNENLAKIAEQYLKKGSKVYVEGQLRTRKWQDQEGMDRYSTEVHLQGFAGQITMLGDPRNGNGGEGTKSPTGNGETTGDADPGGEENPAVGRARRSQRRHSILGAPCWVAPLASGATLS